MAWKIAVVCAVVWTLGMLASATADGFIHLLLVPVAVAAVMHIVESRRALA